MVTARSQSTTPDRLDDCEFVGIVALAAIAVTALVTHRSPTSSVAATLTTRASAQVRQTTRLQRQALRQRSNPLRRQRHHPHPQRPQRRCRSSPQGLDRPAVFPNHTRVESSMLWLPFPSDSHPPLGSVAETLVHLTHTRPPHPFRDSEMLDIEGLPLSPLTISHPHSNFGQSKSDGIRITSELSTHGCVDWPVAQTAWLVQFGRGECAAPPRDCPLIQILGHSLMCRWNRSAKVRMVSPASYPATSSSISAGRRRR